MALGGGPLRNIGHGHFIKTLVIFMLILLAGIIGYHAWLKHEVTKENNARYEARRPAPQPNAKNLEQKTNVHIIR